MMTWEEVRIHYPNQWIIFEALAWQDEGKTRHILEMRVVKGGCNSRTVLKESNEYSRNHPQQRFYFTNTEWDTPRIGTPLRMIRTPRGYAEHFDTVTPEPITQLATTQDH